MTTPRVIELPRRLEPVTRDTFNDAPVIPRRVRARTRRPVRRARGARS